MLLNQTKIELTDCSSILSNASPKSTPDRLISFLSGYSLSARVLTIFVKDGIQVERQDWLWRVPKFARLALSCKMQGYPSKTRVQTFINLSRSLCKEHKSSILNSDQIKKFHNPEFPTYETILSKLESMTAYIRTREGKSNYSVHRLATLELNKNYINKLISCILELTSSRTISTFNV